MGISLLILATFSSTILFTTGSTEGLILKCNQDFLFSVTEEDGESGGVALTILLDDDTYSSSSTKNYKQQVQEGQRLSDECGENFLRCKDPLKLTTLINKTAYQHLVFIPLRDGLLIVELVQSGLQVSLSNRVSLNSPQSADTKCSPVKAFEIGNDYYLACVDSKRHYISMHRIFLNKKSLQESRLAVAPFVHFNIYTGIDMQTLSNFVYFEEVDSFSSNVAFAVGNSMYIIDILAYLGNDYGDIGTNCTHVKYLEYIGGNQLLAYCRFMHVHFNTQSEVWESQEWNTWDGIPYICPNRSIELRVFASPMYIKYAINSLVGNINLQGNGFHNGVCFGAANKSTWFVYSDMTTGVYVVNMRSFQITPLMSDSCEVSGCLSVDVVDNRYVVIRKNDQNDKKLLVFDMEHNASKVTANHYTPDLFKLVSNVNYPGGCGEGNGTVINFVASNSGAVIAGSMIGALLFLGIIITAVIILIVVQGHKIKRPRRIPPISSPIQDTETEQSESSDKVLANSVTTPHNGVAHPVSTTQTSPVSCVQNTHDASSFRARKNSPIEAHNKTGNTQQVGNGDDKHFLTDTNSSNSSKEEGLIYTATPENIATLNHGASLGHNSPRDQPMLYLHTQPTNLQEATPKLMTANNDHNPEKWAEEDNSSNSSGYDDKQPLLSD